MIAFADALRWLFGVIGLILAFPLTKLVLALARDWGAQAQAVRFTADGVRGLYDRAERISETLDAITHRLDRAEFILTGDQGVNGLRGDVARMREEVQEVRQTLFDQNTSTHGLIGEWGLWRAQMDRRMQDIEARTAKRKRKAAS